MRSPTPDDPPVLPHAPAVARARRRATPRPAVPAITAGFAPLTTERLTLRPLQPGDAEALHRLVNDWEVSRTLAAVPFPYPRALADDWIASTLAQIERGSAYHLAVTGREGEQEMLVGAVGLRMDPDARVASLGYWVGRRFWGHGVASEAAGRLARWALANLDIDRLRASVATDNPGSMAVLRRIGFRPAGEGRELFLARGGEHRVLHFEARREDLPANANRQAAEDGTTPEAAPDAGPRPGPGALLLVAACALVDTDGRVLLARRPEGKSMAGLWEFPGGKLAPGETPEAALIRELKEELGIDVARSCLAPFAFASHAYDRFHLLMPLYLCRRWRGSPRARESQTLAWVMPDRLAEYRMPPADLPLIPLLRDFL